MTSLSNIELRDLSLLKYTTIAVDTKNFALFTGGISAFFRPLLETWVERRAQYRFVLVGPHFDRGRLKDLKNCRQHLVNWPKWLPRATRHPIYDNFYFPRALRVIHPDFVFTPYHDVRLPKCVPSVMMIHDTCINDLPDVYPLKVRAYYQHMLKVNLVRARHVLTVSETSRACVLARYGIAMERVSVVPNTLEPGFLTSSSDEARAAEARVRQSDSVRLFYTGGSEFRKNTRRLMEAIDLLASRGIDPQLWVTGSCDAGWRDALNGMPDSLRARLHFVGRLGVTELRAHYLAADAVVYPSLCEGFGRACLEAMELGVPIACSDIPALSEVAGDYPVYLDPRDVTAMAEGIALAATRGRQSPHHDPRFERDAVSQRFVETMDMILSRELDHA